jgi:hypothetical protein
MKARLAEIAHLNAKINTISCPVLVLGMGSEIYCWWQSTGLSSLQPGLEFFPESLIQNYTFKYLIE